MIQTAIGRPVSLRCRINTQLESSQNGRKFEPNTRSFSHFTPIFAGAGTVAYPAFDEIAPGMTPDGWADEGWYRLIQGGHNYLLVQKTPLFEPFLYKNDHFTKTGSGQT
jgi:hypothetical protein